MLSLLQVINVMTMLNGFGVIKKQMRLVDPIHIAPLRVLLSSQFVRILNPFFQKAVK